MVELIGGYGVAKQLVLEAIAAGKAKVVLITCADLSGGKFRKNRVIIATPAPPA